MKLAFGFSILSILSTSLANTVCLGDCNINGCHGEQWNQFCCADGTLSGPAVSSYESSMSAKQATREAAASSREASLNSGNAAAATDDWGSFKKRAATVTVEISSGVTCAGASVVTLAGLYGVSSDSNSNSISNSNSDPTSKPSTGVAAMITQHAILAVGAAGAVAYGAM